jgi:uncharacterized membrane protein
MKELSIYIELIAKIIESLGVVIIAMGSFFFIFRYIFFYIVKNIVRPFAKLRRELGNAILLGLEVLVAADIVATVSTEPDLDNVLILAAIVGIRTFLSFALEVELHGRFPWQADKKEKELEMNH